ncbi:hypothetical protein F5146DRAFT_749483 [Armillaria mellea]|nr:hypothetical protein F5146DRAFT_749483 [Armillaria mellea]
MDTVERQWKSKAMRNTAGAFKTVSVGQYISALDQPGPVEQGTEVLYIASLHSTNVFIDVLEASSSTHSLHQCRRPHSRTKKQPSPRDVQYRLGATVLWFPPGFCRPTLAFMVPVLLMAGLVIPWISAYVEKIAVEARKQRRLKSFGVKP